MRNSNTKPQTLLSTLWVFLLLNMVFRDLHQFGKDGFLQEMIRGTVNGVKITEELMLLGGFLAEIPILMILLSRVLPGQANKWANIIASIITFLVLVSALPSADMDDIFFLIIETITFIVIIRIAITLPRNAFHVQHN